MPTLPISLTSPVQAALASHAETLNLRATDLATRVIEDYLADRNLLDGAVADDIINSRSLIDRAVSEALRIVEVEGFRPSITFDAIQSVSSDPQWLADYARLVRDDPYKTGSPLKQTINQNLGFFIKKAVRGVSVIGANGRPENVKVKGSIIQSYTPLAQN